MNTKSKKKRDYAWLKKLRKSFSWLFKKRLRYKPIPYKEYLEKFGITKIGGTFTVQDKEKLDKAYIKAWENRNFEIDKFWTRAAYFWGFIVLIFGGYISLLTSEHNQKAIEMRIDLYLVMLGFLFSLAWYLVIRGSKFWQQNWEGHIDRLEDFVSGPIYKTIFYSGYKNYSVSKLNEVMALAVIVVWSSLLINYLNSHFSFTLNFKKIDLIATLAVLATTIFSLALTFGYCLRDYKSDQYSFFDRHE